MNNTCITFQNLGSLSKQRKMPEEIAHRIRLDIIGGNLPNGSRLPSEQDMATTLQVSRKTLREGLRILESQGLLQIKAGQNGGAFISEANEESAYNSLINFLHNKQLKFSHLTEIRKLVESHIVREAVKKITDAQILMLEEIQQNSVYDIMENGSARIRALEIAFHGQLASITGNPLLTFINAFIGHLLIGLKQKLKPDDNFSLAVANAHGKIIQALKQRDEEKAVSAIVDDIEMVMSALETLAENQSGLNWKLIAE